MPNVGAMSAHNRIAEAIRRSVEYIPGNLRASVLALISPVSLGIITATLIAWAGSHFFGIGEIVGYVKVSALASEGVAIGNIVVGGQHLAVFVVPGPMPGPKEQRDDALSSKSNKAISGPVIRTR